MLRIIMLIALLVPLLGLPTVSWGQIGEALCGKWLGGTTEQAERWLACWKAVEEGRHPLQLLAAERWRQLLLEERSVSALEEVARAQRDQANRANRPTTCLVIGFQSGYPVWRCY